MSFQKLVLVDKTIKDLKKLTDAFTTDCAVLKYSSSTKTSDVTQFLTEKNITHVDRVCVIFHDAGKSVNKYDFINQEVLFSLNDLKSTTTKKSVNYEFIINLINTLTPTHIDFLACDLLKYKDFKTYFESLITNCNNQNLKVGASDNKTGNVKYGGDWTLESTGEDIKNIYFTGDIKYWEVLLDQLVDYYNLTNYSSFQKDFNGNYINENGEIIEKRIPEGTYKTTSWGDEYHSAISIYDWDEDEYNIVPHLENVKKIYNTEYAYAALMADGSVYVWGDEGYGGSSVYDDARYRGYLYDGTGENHDTSNNKVTGIVEIYSNNAAFAAVNASGEVFVWGHPWRGGTSAIGNTNTRGWVYTGDGTDTSGNTKISGVTKVYSTSKSFAALLSDGRVFVWGRVSEGGSSSFAEYGDDYNRGYLYDGDGVKDASNNQVTNIVRIMSTRYAYAALNASGNIFVWGDKYDGGALVYGDETTRGYLHDPLTDQILSGMTKVYGNEQAFAAINPSGNVFVWGDEDYGGSNVYGDSDYNGYLYDGNGEYDTSGNTKVTGITKIYHTDFSFAALNGNGEVFVWGEPYDGGSSVYGDDTYRGWLYNGNGQYDTSGNTKVSNIVTIKNNDDAYAALDASGSIFVWGDYSGGGSSVYDDNSTRGWLYDGNGYSNSGNNKLTGFKSIYAAGEAFAAIKKDDGSIFVWGSLTGGGSSVYDDSDYRGYLYNGDGKYDTSGNTKITGANKIYATYDAFSAVLSGNEVFAWGQAEEGGQLARYDDYNYEEDIVPYANGSNKFKMILSTQNYGGMCEMAQTGNIIQQHINRTNSTNPLGKIPVELLKKAIRGYYTIIYENN